MDKRLLKVSDVSNQLNISKSAVYSLVQNGFLPVFKIGKSLRFEQVDIDKYLANHKVKLTILGNPDEPNSSN